MVVLLLVLSVQSSSINPLPQQRQRDLFFVLLSHSLVITSLQTWSVKSSSVTIAHDYKSRLWFVAPLFAHHGRRLLLLL